MMESLPKDNRSLSQNEINALLVNTGVNMGGSRNVVITSYGHGKFIDKIAVNIFEDSEGKSKSNADTYCELTNALVLEGGDSWISAKIISENTPYNLSDFNQPFTFEEFLKTFETRAIQKTFSVIDRWDLMKALKGVTDEAKEKAFNNMSKHRSQMLKEDIEYMGPIRNKDIYEAQKKILDVIHHLEDTGEIVYPAHFYREKHNDDK